VVSPTDDAVVIDKTKAMYIEKQISQTESSYYSFAWLNTASIGLLNFGEQFENYQVEKTTKRFLPQET